MEQPDKQPPMPESQRRQGFLLAMFLIGGFLVLIFLPAARGDIDGAKELAGIFSGWIASIVGFYFIQGQAQQVAVAAKESGLEQGGAAVETLTVALERYRKLVQDQKNYIEELTTALAETETEEEGA